MTPQEIAELVYSEFTPLASMTIDEAKERVAQLIQECCEKYHQEETNKKLNP